MDCDVFSNLDGAQCRILNLSGFVDSHTETSAPTLFIVVTKTRYFSHDARKPPDRLSRVNSIGRRSQRGDLSLRSGSSTTHGFAVRRVSRSAPLEPLYVRHGSFRSPFRCEILRTARFSLRSVAPATHVLALFVGQGVDFDAFGVKFDFGNFFV